MKIMTADAARKLTKENRKTIKFKSLVDSLVDDVHSNIKQAVKNGKMSFEFELGNEYNSTKEIDGCEVYNTVVDTFTDYGYEVRRNNNVTTVDWSDE